MSMLALRAAEREAMYVERRMETSLMSEADLAARSVAQLMLDVRNSLRRDAPGALTGNPLTSVTFDLDSGRLSVSGPAEGARRFRENFAGFLTEGVRVPTYDLVTRVYRTEPGMTREEPSTRKTDGSGTARQQMNAKMETDAEARDEIFEQAEYEGFKTYSRNVEPQSQNMRSMPGAPAETQAAQPSSLAPPSVMNAAKIKKSDIEPPPLRSKTVSKNRSLAELSSESADGLIPYMTDEGLEILFWTKIAGGHFSGCVLDMGVLRDMIADVIPDIISDARILTVLDDAGNPIITPKRFPVSPPDWSRPFVAREISPLLPRWEAGAWLTDPAALTSRAEYARTAVWIQVAILGFVIITGSVAVIMSMSHEMRVASQKTTFVANVTHELKTPLTSIRLYAELLLSGKQRDEERKREYLRTMMSEADRLSHIVDNVLTFSRRERELKFETLTLSLLVAETLSPAEPHLSKQGFAVTYSGESDAIVKGNGEALKQVVMNLILNAEKYSGPSREISVKVSRGSEHAAVSVMDRGTGVDPAMPEKIFHEFVRCDDSLTASVSGTGLGLAIARDISRRHGGDVTYSPRQGGGSIFTLVLPLAR